MLFHSNLSERDQKSIQFILIASKEVYELFVLFSFQGVATEEAPPKKLSEMTDEEKRKKRAERFAITFSDTNSNKTSANAKLSKETGV